MIHELLDTTDGGEPAKNHRTGVLRAHEMLNEEGGPWNPGSRTFELTISDGRKIEVVFTLPVGSVSLRPELREVAEAVELLHFMVR
jgi:hypothetical protein